MEPGKKQNLKTKRQKKKPSPEESLSLTSILDLPENILTHILSFLPTTAAAQTSAVAPAWRNLWHSVPVLEFHMQAFHSSDREMSVRDTRQLFAEMLNQALLQRPRHFAVQTFRLTFAYRSCDHIRSYVDSWLQYVIGAKAVKLDLCFHSWYPRSVDEDGDKDDAYAFHYSDLVNSSVTVLKLDSCDLCMPSNKLPIKIHSLREIHLTYLSGTQGEEMVHLVSSCVNLESLSIVMMELANNWKIASQSLKHIKFYCFTGLHPENISVEICAPNLESLILFCSYNVKCYVKDTYSLIAADVVCQDFVCWTNIVSSLRGVERLFIQNMWFHTLSLSAKEVFSETFVFHNLKHLELMTGYSEKDILGLEILLKRCPQLETLALVHQYNPSGDIKTVTGRSIVLQMPHLRSVEMKNFRKTKDELFVVGLLQKHARVLDKIVAYPVNEESRSSFVL